MKKIKKFILISLFLLISFLALNAQVMVVRIDRDKVFLDTSSITGVKVGDTFKVIVSKEKLINPKTKKFLGEVPNYSEEGKIIETYPLYAIGKLNVLDNTIKIGQEAIIEGKTSSESNIESQENNLEKGRKMFSLVSYPTIKEKVISAIEGNFSLEKTFNQIVTLSSEGVVTVWNEGKDSLEKFVTTRIPKGKKPVTLSAYAIKGEDQQIIFVTCFDESSTRFVSLVYRLQDNELKQITKLPYFVKTLDCGTTLWGQRINDKKPGNAFEIAYENGTFTPEKAQVFTYGNWLTGVNYLALEKLGVYLTSKGEIQLTKEGEKIASMEEFSAKAPNRVKYKQEILKIFPSLQILNNNEVLVAVAINIPKNGVISDTFGQYEKGSIKFLDVKEDSLELVESVDLEGVVWDLGCYQNNILATQVLSNGSSKIVKIIK